MLKKIRNIEDQILLMMLRLSISWPVDLKSDNILIALSGDLKISDFGFCKQTNGSGSFSIGIMSQQKINYVTSAPELLEGKAERANQMSDIFSLGCLFFTFLTRGSHLFQETDDQNAHIIPTNILEGRYWLEGGYMILIIIEVLFNLNS